MSRHKQKMIQSVLDHTKGVGDRHNVMIFSQQGKVFSKVVQDLNDIDDMYFNCLHTFYISTFSLECEDVCRFTLHLSLETEEGVPKIHTNQIGE